MKNTIKINPNKKSDIAVAIVVIIIIALTALLTSCTPKLTNTIGNEKYKKVLFTHEGYIYYQHSEKDFMKKGNYDSVPVLNCGDTLYMGDYIIFY